MSGLSLLGGISAYTRYNSVPSLVAGVGVASLLGLSSMRVRDNMSWGLEGAAASSTMLLIPTLRRALLTKSPISWTLALASAASTAYYTSEIIHRQSHPQFSV